MLLPILPNVIALPQQVAQYYPIQTTTIVNPSTTIYTTTERVYSAPIYQPNFGAIYPRTEQVYPTQIYQSNFGSYPRYYRSYPPQVIIQTAPVYYPPAIQSRCTTSIIGSPIPSAVPLDRFTGNPCR
jgi:hypothetical protein